MHKDYTRDTPSSSSINGFLVRRDVLVRGNRNLGKGVTLQRLENQAVAKEQIHAEIGAHHTKKQLQCLLAI